MYLGGGMYAAVEKESSGRSRKKPPPAPGQRRGAGNRGRGLAGRVRAPPPRGARLRSASAHIIGGVGDVSPAMSRAQSEGNVSFEGFGGDDDAASAHAVSDPGARVRAKPADDKSRAWRAAGGSKMKEASKAAPPARRAASLEPSAAPPVNARHSDDRMEERQARRREAREATDGLFGAQGLLGQLREQEDIVQKMYRRPPVAGGPMASAVREAERKAMKEAKVAALLAEREERVRLAERERAEKRDEARINSRAQALARGTAHSVSAPELSAAGDLSTDPEEIEKQKLRVACKMQILNFFDGYNGAVKKMTKDQTKLLLDNMNGRTPGIGTEVVQNCEMEREATIREWTERSQQMDDRTNIEQRLREVNEMCNGFFDTP